jgi:hypothetical protein
MYVLQVNIEQKVQIFLAKVSVVGLRGCLKRKLQHTSLSARISSQLVDNFCLSRSSNGSLDKNFV